MTDILGEFKSWYDPAAARKAAELKAGQEAGKAEAQKGMARAAANNADILEAAQTVARRLAVNGPVTIDDVIHEMRRLGYREADIAPGKDLKSAKNWKGSVFASSEWVCVGQIVSREKTAHGRNVRKWVTKEWLRRNPVNGTPNEASAFHLFRLYEDARHQWPAEELCFMLGSSLLDSTLMSLAQIGRLKYREDGTVGGTEAKTLYGCPVFPVSGVGAICMPLALLNPSCRTAMMECGE